MLRFSIFYVERLYIGSIWNPESAKERKKILRKIIFSCLV